MATVGSPLAPGPALLSTGSAAIDEAAPRKLLGRASIAGAGSLYFQCVQLLSGLITARALGAADYGVVNLARNLVDSTFILTRLGLDIGLQRHFGETRLAVDQSMRLVVLRQLRLSAALLAMVPILALALGLGKVLETHVYHHEGIAQILLCFALALPFVTDVAVLGGAYRGVLRPARSILAEYVLMPTARLLLIVVLLLAGWGLWAVAVGTTVGAVLASAWLALRARRDFPAVSIANESWDKAQRVMRYSSILALAVLVTTLTSIMDILALGRYVPAEQLGQYSLAKTLLLPIGFFAVAFNQGMGALVAERHARADHAGMRQVMTMVLRWTTVGTLPLFAVFLFWGAQITPIFGPSFAIPQPVIAWLAAGQFLVAMLGSMGWALSMTNRHYLELGILFSGLLLAGTLCFTVVPVHGQIGAAIATFCALAAVNLIRLTFARRVLGGFPFDARLLLMVAAGLLIALMARTLVAQWHLGAVWSAICGVGLFMAVYAAACWWYLRSTQLEAKADAMG